MENLKSEILNLPAVASAKAGPKPFAAGETKTLQIANCESRIASCNVSCLGAENKGRHRYYRGEIRNLKSEIINVKIQLNHGDPADDQARLEEIVTDILNQQQKEAQGTGQQALVPDA